MKRHVFFLTAITIAVLLMVSCQTTGGGSSSSTSNSNAAQAQPVLGRNNIPMPEWVYNVPAETGDAMYFVTQGGKVGTTPQKQLLALSNANGEAAMYISGKTDALIKNYSELAGEVDNAQSLQSLKTGIINRARANTAGIRRTSSWEAADGELYALHIYDKVVFRGDIKAEVNSFQRNPAAAAAHFQADNFFAEMEKELEK